MYKAPKAAVSPSAAKERFVRILPVRARRGESPQILNLPFVTAAANDGTEPKVPDSADRINDWCAQQTFVWRLTWRRLDSATHVASKN